ncbi:MAG: ACP S-malonyltransferase [Elusimicrobia bacterium]|nr:ACP S-malonyltransferase [Elusimicrobiota bacterium]
MPGPYCVMFAGQSIQESGMCRELWRIPAARRVLERLKPSLGADLESITTEMPNGELALTFNAQRAIHAHHLGNWFAYGAAHPGLELSGAIGHSMGVVAALVAAEALSVEDSGTFIRARAQSFSEVCKTFTEPMGLAAVSTDDFQDVVDELAAVEGVSVALHNTIGRGTLGGTLKALEAFSRHADEEGWPVKAKILKVEGPYHTKAFSPCRPALAKAAAALKIAAPKVPVYMGTSGAAETDPGRIRELIVAQADSCERHLQAVRAAYAGGCRNFLEAGFKPQPVTWLSDQLRADDGALLPGVSALAVKTEDLGR